MVDLTCQPANLFGHLPQIPCLQLVAPPGLLSPSKRTFCVNQNTNADENYSLLFSLRFEKRGQQSLILADGLLLYNHHLCYLHSKYRVNKL